MKLINLTCPNCNASVQINDSMKTAFCPYCGSKFAIDDEIRHVQYDNAEQAGYEFEKGRLRAQLEQQTKHVSDTQPQLGTQPPKQRRTWLWVLGWIFCFPIPLTILIVRSQKLSKKAKIIILCVLWAVFLLLGFIGEADNTKGASNTANYTQSIVNYL